MPLLYIFTNHVLKSTRYHHHILSYIHSYYYHLLTKNFFADVQIIRSASILYVFIAIFQETKRPSKEMQVTIARQLGLDPSTVSNFFMNARRRSVDKWKDDKAEAVLDADMMSEMDPDESGASSPPLALNSSSTRGYDPEATPTSLKSNTVLVSATPAAVVQHLHQESGMTPTAALDL